MGWKRTIAGALLPKRVSRTIDPEFGNQIVALEGRRSDWTIDELRGFEELKASAWRGLASLGYEIVRHYRPKVVVELGTHMGMSALAMGMALRDLNEGGRLYAVDTWGGDAHSGLYGDDIYNTLLKRRAQLGLDDTLVPLRMTFDEAKAHVPTVIDLIHIDGFHTFDAVAHDWSTYRSMMRPQGGIAMFHDIWSFPGVRRFWRWTSWRHEHCSVRYSSGLGLLRL